MRSFAIESGMDAQQTFGAMQQGVEASKQLQSQLDQDKVADTVSLYLVSFGLEGRGSDGE